MKILCGFVSISLITFALYLSGDLSIFIDLPSLVIGIMPIPFVLFSKYGNKAFTFYKQEESLQSKIATDGGYLALLLGFLGTLIGLILMLSNLSDQAAIAPAMAVSFISTFYGFLIFLFVFYPFQKRIKNE